MRRARSASNCTSSRRLSPFVRHEESLGSDHPRVFEGDRPGCGLDGAEADQPQYHHHRRHAVLDDRWRDLRHRARRDRGMGAGVDCSLRRARWHGSAPNGAVDRLRRVLRFHARPRGRRCSARRSRRLLCSECGPSSCSRLGRRADDRNSPHGDHRDVPHLVHARPGGESRDRRQGGDPAAPGASDAPRVRRRPSSASRCTAGCSSGSAPCSPSRRGSPPCSASCSSTASPTASPSIPTERSPPPLVQCRWPARNRATPRSWGTAPPNSFSWRHLLCRVRPSIPLASPSVPPPVSSASSPLGWAPSPRRSSPVWRRCAAG